TLCGPDCPLLALVFVFLIIRRPLRSPLFPYTTLFRSSSGIEFAGRPARLVLAEDVSDRTAYERDLAWRATHDGLTGLTRLQALRSEEHTSELQSRENLVCRLLLEKKKKKRRHKTDVEE